MMNALDVVPTTGVLDVDGLTLWDRQSGESSRAMHAFHHFLRLPPWQRSLRRAYRDHQVICKSSPNPPRWASPEWAAWSKKFQWVARVEAHDADVAARTRLQALAAIDQMNARHCAVAMQLQEQVVQRLEQIVASKAVQTMSLVQCAHLLDRAALVERRARGAPTEIIRTIADESNALLDLSALSAEQLTTFEHLIDLASTRTQKGGADHDA